MKMKERLSERETTNEHVWAQTINKKWDLTYILMAHKKLNIVTVEDMKTAISM